MKYLLLGGGSILFGGGIILGWLLFGSASPAIPSTLSELTDTAKEKVDSLRNEVVSSEVLPQAETVATSTLPILPEAGLLLSDFTLGTSQRQFLEAAGINPETFTITNAMVACATEQLGGDRVQAFIAGDTPTMFEMAQLLPCLRTE